MYVRIYIYVCACPSQRKFSVYKNPMYSRLIHMKINL